MRVAIFDDVAKDAEHLKSIVLEWSSERNYPGILIDVFETVRNLNFELKDHQQYDIFFMDIMTPQDRSAGFRAAEEIRMKDIRAAIVFTTSSREYIESAFEINASQYLMKPLVKDKVYRVLDHLTEEMHQDDKSFAEFSGIGEKLRLAYKDILYIKSLSRQHRAVVHMTDGREHVIALSGVSFKDFTSKALPEEFLQCHRGYIVNLRYVTGYSHEHVLLSHSTEVPVGDDYYQNLIKGLVKKH